MVYVSTRVFLVCEKFMLNLCFRLPEYVFSSFTRHPKNKFGAEEMLSPIEFQVLELCQKFVLNLCYLCLKVPVLLFLVLYIKQKFGGGAGTCLK